MYFIGQPTIMRQLAEYLPRLRANPKLGMSFLFRAPSGWGKTRMAFMLCNYLSGGEFEYCLGDNITAQFRRRVVFIDEVHAIKSPEWLYPIIDSEKHVLVFATNEVSVLPEALSNRCTNFVFEDYAQHELREICRINLNDTFEEKVLDYIIESSAANPRVIRSTCSKINMMDASKISALTEQQFKKFMSYMFGINDGLDTVSQRYLKVLSELGGSASLKTLSTALHIDEGSLRFYVEPVLLYKKRIRITSKGRSLV